MYDDYDDEDDFLEGDDYNDLLLNGTMMELWEMDEEIGDPQDVESAPAQGCCGSVVGIFIVVLGSLILLLRV